MSELDKKVKTHFRFMLIFTILTIFSLPGLIIAFVSGPIWGLAVPCLIILIIGFYGLPIGWIFYPMIREQRSIVIAITEDENTNIRELAIAFGKNEKNMKRAITQLIQKRYLKGYKIDTTNNSVVMIEKKLVSKPVTRKKCENCGAPLGTDEKICAHCNIPL